MSQYIPRQRDIVWINFSPSSGLEITKRRPGVVVSNESFNIRTNFCVVCPITSTNKKYPSTVSLDDKEYSIKGNILTHQVRSVDYHSRQIEYADQLSPVKWIETIEKIKMIF